MNMLNGKSTNTGDLKDFSIEELEAEIKRQKTAEVPTVINPLMSEKLINGCKEYIEFIKQKRATDKCEHFIFEAAMEAVFDSDVWKWINKNTRL